MVYENEKRWYPSAPFRKKQDAGLDGGQAPETYLMVLAWLSAQAQYG